MVLTGAGLNGDASDLDVKSDGSSLSLAWRPVEYASPQNVDVQVRYALARPRSVVNHGSVAFRRQLTLPGELRRDRQQVTQQLLVLRRGFIQGSHMLAGDNEEVDR